MFRELLYPCWIFVGFPRLWNPCRCVLLWNYVNLCSSYLWRLCLCWCYLCWYFLMHYLSWVYTLDTIDANCRDTLEIFFSILTMADRWVVLISQPHLHTYPHNWTAIWCQSYDCHRGRVLSPCKAPADDYREILIPKRSNWHPSSIWSAEKSLLACLTLQHHRTSGTD